MKILALFVTLLLLSGTTLAQTAPSAALSWTASSTTAVTGYNVYRFVGTCSAPTFVKLTTTPTAALSYTDTTVTPGTTYCYTVTAVSPGGESQGAGTWQLTIPTFTASTTPNPPGSFSAVVSN